MQLERACEGAAVVPDYLPAIETGVVFGFCDDELLTAAIDVPVQQAASRAAPARAGATRGIRWKGRVCMLVPPGDGLPVGAQ